eukprot:790025-Prorocentrum_minimum.AAC.1
MSTVSFPYLFTNNSMSLVSFPYLFTNNESTCKTGSLVASLFGSFRRSSPTERSATRYSRSRSGIFQHLYYVFV